MKTVTLENELATALFRLSFGKYSVVEAKEKASRLVKNIDFDNDMIAHKGVNWYAKEILKKMKHEESTYV